MRKIVLLMAACCLCFGSLFAQNAADKLGADADAAIKAKNYAVAFTKYEQYLQQTNNADANRVFNCGYAAFQAKKYAEAIKYLDMSIANKKSVENCYVYKAVCLKALNKTADLESTVSEGLAAFPNNSNLQTLFFGFTMKNGLAAQKAGKFDDAEAAFKKCVDFKNVKQKVQALNCLGILNSNQGAKILAAAAPIAQSDATKYAAEKKKAAEYFTTAKDYLTKALAIDPANVDAKKALTNVTTALK